MKRFRPFLLIGSLVLLLLGVQTAAAHPLGNFSVNRYSRLTVVSTDQIDLRYIVDMAEIPTLRERQGMDTNGDGLISTAEEAAYLDQMLPTLQENLTLWVAETPIGWEQRQHQLTFASGQGDLPVMRLELDLTAVLPPNSDLQNAEFTDNNFDGQVGWQEVVVTSADGMTLTRSSVPAADISNELQSYADDLLRNPPAVNQASFAFGETAVVAASVDASTQTGLETAVDNATAVLSSDEQFANLLTTALDQPGAIFFAILIAIGLGAAHALTPGHGKTIVGAYLVGSRGTAKHALFLGLTTTLTHTIGVFAFGLIVLFASRFILPEQLYPWLGVISGMLVVLIGFSLLRGRLATLLGVSGHHHHHGLGHDHTHDHDHHHDHDHDHDHGHSHLPPPDMEPSLRNLLALGISGGLLPCPSALILLLSAIALDKVGMGLLLIVAFSIGLAGVLTGIGLLLVYANRWFGRFTGMGNGRLAQAIPVLSALFITIAGVFITLSAFADIGPI